MNCREKLTVADVGFIYDEAPETAVMLREMKDSLCIIIFFVTKL
jgi:hypothetical protein